MKGKKKLFTLLLITTLTLFGCAVSETDAKKICENFVRDISKNQLNSAFNRLSDKYKTKIGGIAGFKKKLATVEIERCGKFKRFKSRLSYHREAGYFFVILSQFENGLVHTDIRLNKKGKIIRFNISKTTATK